MNISLSRYDLANDDAAGLIDLVMRAEIWEGMRVDGKDQQEIANTDWTGSYLSILRDSESKDALGFQLFIPRFVGVYEMHVGFVESARGNQAKSAVIHAVNAMFMETDAIEIFIHCPQWNPCAWVFAATLNADSLFSIPAFAQRGNKTQSATVCHKRLHDWIFERAEHFRVEQCAKDGRSEIEINMRSATVELAKRQPLKAQAFYDIYAGLSGQPRASIIPFPAGAIVLFADLRIFIIEGKVAFSEEIPSCH
jgi:hypothetical protein